MPPLLCIHVYAHGNTHTVPSPLCVFLYSRASQVPLAVSILISSDFLQMQRLVEECLRFVGEHLTEIVKLPIDLSCLGDKMVLQLAKVRVLFEHITRVYLAHVGCTISVRYHICT